MTTTGDPFYSPTHKAATRPRKPRERLFTFTKADDTPMACDLFNNGSFGFEAQILERGELLDARGGFATRDEAIAWANGERRTLEG